MLHESGLEMQNLLKSELQNASELSIQGKNGPGNCGGFTSKIFSCT